MAGTIAGQPWGSSPLLSAAVSGPYTVWTPTTTSQYTAANQWKRDPGILGADQYDAVGNMTAVAASAASPDVVANTFSYDAENHMIASNVGNTGQVSYLYDGEGRRVEKIAGPATTIFVYDAMGSWRRNTRIKPLGRERSI